MARYKCSTSQHDKFLYDDTQYLLALTLADNALYGVESVEGLWDLEIPGGDDALTVRWNEKMLQ